MTSTWTDGEHLVLPLAAERLVVTKRVFAKSIVRISTHVEDVTSSVQEETQHVSVDVQRVRLDQIVEFVPAVRQEGDTTIYPIVEEELVVSKRLVLREELRITRVVSTTPVRQEITLRRVTADVVRTPVESESAPPTDVRQQEA